jgi:pantoate--beta-alanine ligase
MRQISGVEQLRAQVAEWRQVGASIALVPTMGNLHRGHLQLVERAATLAERVVVSIFVNPMQFSPGEDFDSYPRTPEQDVELLAQHRVDLVFTPAAGALYPRGTAETTRVEVPGVSEGLCGDFRPGHFTGVATVVARLFNLVQPQVAVFGEKDYQQLAVIRRMVADLCWPIRIAGVATVREPDGLALSSRNRYLSAAERARAPVLYQTLCRVAAQVRAGGRPYPELEAEAMRALQQAGLEPDYVSIRHAETLEPPDSAAAPCVVLAAAHLGGARLIDNVRV